MQLTSANPPPLRGRLGGGQARSAPRIVRSTPSISTSLATSRKRHHTPLPATLTRCRPPPQGGRGERDDPCIPGAHAAGGRLPSPRPSRASGRGGSAAGGSAAGSNSRLSSDLPVNNRQRTGAHFLDCNHEVQTRQAGRSPRAVSRRPGRPSFRICQPRASRRAFRDNPLRKYIISKQDRSRKDFLAARKAASKRTAPQARMRERERTREARLRRRRRAPDRRPPRRALPRVPSRARRPGAAR
jgi:hypothetical protein